MWDGQNLYETTSLARHLSPCGAALAAFNEHRNTSNHSCFLLQDLSAFSSQNYLLASLPKVAFRPGPAQQHHSSIPTEWN